MTDSASPALIRERDRLAAMTKEDLQRLRDAFHAAKAVYMSNKSDGTVDGDINERTLQDACTKARVAYETALDSHLRATGVLK